MSGNNLIAPKNRMEQLSVAYVHAIASYCGYGADSVCVDHDSVDMTISSSAGRKPKLDIQLKATTQIDDFDTEFSFCLSIKNYNDLRCDTIVPRILVVLCMPKQQTEWIEHTGDYLKLMKCAYYASLSGMGETENKESVHIKLTKNNLFSPDKLTEIMQKISQGIVL